MTKGFKWSDIALERRRFVQRWKDREIARAQRRQAEQEKRAQQREEIDRMHYYGPECTLPERVMAELKERVRYRGWRSTW